MLVTDLLAEECRVASCSWSVSELRVHDSSSQVLLSILHVGAFQNLPLCELKELCHKRLA